MILCVPMSSSSHMIMVSITDGDCTFIYVKASVKDEVAVDKCVSIQYFSYTHVKSIYLHSEEQASETSLQRLNQKNFIYLKEVKECWKWVLIYQKEQWGLKLIILNFYLLYASLQFVNMNILKPLLTLNLGPKLIISMLFEINMLSHFNSHSK